MLKLRKKYFDEREDVAFAFLFGSAESGKIRREGDIDIALYFWPEKDLEWEAFGKRYKGENAISLDLERLLKKEVDLVVLNMIEMHNGSLHMFSSCRLAPTN